MKENSSSVLIIDDEPGNLDAYQQLLQAHGFDTKSISTDTEAFAVIADRDFDAVIIDLRTPGQPIIDLAEKIKKASPFCCIFILTNELAPAYIKKALKLGVENCLIKPFLPTILLESVRKGIERICLAREKEILEGKLSALTKDYKSFKARYEQIKDMLIYDPVTGSLKQDYLIYRLESEIKRAKRHEHWLSLFLFQPRFKGKDIRNTRDILEYIAKFLMENIRSIDILGRYKEGFAIIMPETKEQGALALGQRLKKDIAERLLACETFTLEINNKEDEKIAQGYSTYPIDSHLPKRLIRIAESRLQSDSFS